MNNQQTKPDKPAGYINVAADVNFLQRVVCCNHNIANNTADKPTPTAQTTPLSETRRFNFAEETPITRIDDNIEIEK